MQKPLRHNSAAYMVAQIKRSLEKYGGRQIILRDSYFTIDKKRLRDFCRLMIESGLNKKVDVSFQTGVAVNLEDDEWRLLRKSGVTVISYGLERLAPELRRYMRKAGSTKQAFEMVKETGRRGFGVNAHILINFPIDDQQKLEQEKQLLEELLPYITYFHVNYLTPAPGTKLYDPSSSHAGWYLRPQVYHKILSYYEIAYNITLPGLEFNLFDLPENTLEALRKFKEEMHWRSVRMINRSRWFQAAFLVDMMLARASFLLYKRSPPAENVVFHPLKKARIAGFRLLLRLLVHGRPGFTGDGADRARTKVCA
jgi:radical SAM superfamily enzyme YgiQ (UPF0313 family)